MSLADTKVAAQIADIENADISDIVNLLKANGMNYGSVELYRNYFCKVLLGDRLIGCVAVIPRDGFSEIKSLLVVKEHRSLKVFNRISDFVTLRALEQNHPCVVVKTNKHNPAVLLYRRKAFEPLREAEYPDIYRQLRQDCIACHQIVKSICNPTYMIIDTRKKRYDISEWQEKNAASQR